MPHIGIGLATLLGSGIAGGSALAAAKMGSNTNKNIAAQQQTLIQQQLARTKPAYEQAYNYYQGLLSGDPYKVMSTLGPDINATNAFFNSAKKNIVENAMSRGGGLDKGLANAEAGRATSLANLWGQVRPQAAAGLSSLVSGDQSQALTALATAQQGQYQQSLMNQQALSGVGSFLARLFATPGLWSTRFDKGVSYPQYASPSALPNTNFPFLQSSSPISYYPGLSH